MLSLRYKQLGSGTALAIVGTLIALGWTGLAQAQTKNVYRIGNSFTWDSRPPEMDGLSVDTPITVHSGYHVRCSSTLATIAGDQSVCVTPTSEGVWQVALPGYTWDTLVVQPFAGANATLTSDTASIRSFLDALESNPANEDTQLLIYQSWPFFSGAQQWSDWLSDAGASTSHRQDYYHDLRANLATQGVQAEIIPNADVLYYITNHLDEFDALSSTSELYRDSIHMSGIGQYINAVTVLTYLNGEDLTGVIGDSYGGNLPQQSREQLQSVIWKIVNAVQNPGDLNADGQVTIADYDAWKAAYGTSAAGVDANLDGIVDAADYTIWRNAYSTATTGLSVPEPCSISLFAFGALLSPLAVPRRVHAAVVPFELFP